MQMLIFAGIGIVVLLKMSIHVLKEFERGVILRMGRYAGTRGPGLRFIWPFIDKIYIVDQRTVTMDVPPQDVITKDNVSIKVNAVLYFRIMNPERSVIQIENYLLATSQLAQTTLRSVCGESELDELLSNREEINLKIQEIIDKQSDPWGVKVSMVELKHIDLPDEMRRAMAKQAEAERERRAKIIQAEGEYQASEKLTAAAEIMGKQEHTIQLRYLETLRDIAGDKSNTIVFPLPLEMLKMMAGKRGEE